MRSLVVRNCQEICRHSAAMRNLGRRELADKVLRGLVFNAVEGVLSGICQEKNVVRKFRFSLC